jgi:hypothetical protein
MMRDQTNRRVPRSGLGRPVRGIPSMQPVTGRVDRPQRAPPLGADKTMSAKALAALPASDVMMERSKVECRGDPGRTPCRRFASNISAAPSVSRRYTSRLPRELTLFEKLIKFGKQPGQMRALAVASRALGTDQFSFGLDRLLKPAKLLRGVPQSDRRRHGDVLDA